MKLNRGLSLLKNPKVFRFGTWDIEAADWWNLQVIGVYDGKKYIHCRSVEEFLRLILTKEYNGFRFFAHFGGRYDLNFIYDYLRQNHPHIAISFYSSGSMVVSMTLRSRDKCTVKLCDSFRLLPASLRSLTEAFNVQHKKTSYDFKAMEYGQELIDYNEQDCRGLHEVLECFFAMSQDLHSETLATHALSTFRKDFLKSTLFKPPADAIQAARLSYHGGRVEVYKRKSNNLQAFDVNSMYPYVMCQGIPVEFLGRTRRLKHEDKRFGFVEATVQIPESLYIPPLPVRIPKSGRLFFPTGKIRRFWTSEELQTAETVGITILKIHQAFIFHTEAIFTEYVRHFYLMKKTAGEPLRTIAKLLLNSLYGKFGQHPTRSMFFSEAEAPEGSIPLMSPITGMPTGFAEYKTESKAAHMLPHIACAITAKARLHLLSCLNERTYYCDTDSVFTTDTIETSTELGHWALVGSGEAEFYQPKLYKFKGLWKAKGLNRDESIDDYVHGGTNTTHRSRSIKEALRKDVTACAHVTIEKMMNPGMTKRAWTDENTRPWTLEEIEQ